MNSSERCNNLKFYVFTTIASKYVKQEWAILQAHSKCTIILRGFSNSLLEANRRNKQLNCRDSED